MKGFKVLTVLCGTALLIAGCAVPLGEDYLITRDGTGLIYITDYNLQTYVPIPEAGRRPVTLVNDREDLDISVVWKDENGREIALPFESFAANTVYQAEIKITPKPGYGFYSIPFTYPAGKVSVQIDDLGDPTRTITVIYNNSDDAAITYITDYNLQNYVPVPLAGEQAVWIVETRADVRVEVIWYETSPTNSVSSNPLNFGLGTVYQADIRLTAKTGYRFIPGRSFAYPNGPEITPVPETNPDVRRFDVIYPPTVRPMAISDFNLTPYIPKPISGTTAVTSFAGLQYSGTVSWKNAGTQEILTGPFLPGITYIAELILIPGSGYAFTGIGQDVFTHTGAAAITNPAGSGAVTISFPPTTGVGNPIVVYDTILTERLPKPVNGITPITGITSPQYSGTVAWTPPHGAFQLGTTYTAVLSLQAAPGYTFTGIGQNAFSHGDAFSGSVTNPQNSGTVTITFSVARPPSHQVMTFGPSARENSALGIMEERSADSKQVFIDLPLGQEEVSYSTVLIPGNTSPVNVIIDGHGRTLIKTTPGSLITVAGGVTLTLQNITLEGHPANTASLLAVSSGGRLILGAGVVLKGNETSAPAGGVWVNGGTLSMSSGAVIKGMKARRAGGVLVNNNGRVVMSGGIIGGETSAEGNKVSGRINSGGGVLVDNGSFDMYGGAIQFNEAADDAGHSAGGVVAIEGYFALHAGSIRKNIARGTYSGGGVYAYYNGGYEGYERVFSMDAAAFIEENAAWGTRSGGGIFSNERGFFMEAGTIRRNTAENVESGGGMCCIINDQEEFSMSGGFIKENVAKADDSAGGVYIPSNPNPNSNGRTYKFEGGVIQGNIAYGPRSGGGICARDTDSTLEITGITIEGNYAKEDYSAGGLYISGYPDPGEITVYMEGGTIKGNIADGSSSGGGVYFGGGEFFMQENANDNIVIKGNKATWDGPGGKSAGAMYVTGDVDPGIFFMEAGTIGGIGTGDANTAAFGANGVYVSSNGRLKLRGGKITGNTTGKPGDNKYGVYIANTGEDAFSITDNGKVATDNLVFLATGALIYATPDSNTEILANLSCDNLKPYGDGSNPASDATKLLFWGSSTAGIETVSARFLFENVSFIIKASGTPELDPVSGYSYYYGYHP
jgi:hypothetical protein